MFGHMTNLVGFCSVSGSRGSCCAGESQRSPHSPGWDMLLSSCLSVSPGNVPISSRSRRWPSSVRCQKHDFLLPSLHSWLQVLLKLLLKHKLCRMLFFQPSGAVWKNGKFSLGEKHEAVQERCHWSCGDVGGGLHSDLVKW